MQQPPGSIKRLRSQVGLAKGTRLYEGFTPLSTTGSRSWGIRAFMGYPNQCPMGDPAGDPVGAPKLVAGWWGAGWVFFA